MSRTAEIEARRRLAKWDPVSALAGVNLAAFALEGVIELFDESMTGRPPAELAQVRELLGVDVHNLSIAMTELSDVLRQRLRNLDQAMVKRNGASKGPRRNE